MTPAAPRWLRAVQIGVGIAMVVAVICLARTVDLRALLAALQRASWPLVALVVALNLSGALCRTGYWWVVLSPLGKFSVHDVVRLTFAALAGNLLAPARAGDAFKVWQLKRLFGVEVPVAVAAVGLEKLGEAVALVALVAPLPWLLPGLPERLQVVLKLLPLILAASMVALWLAVRRFSLASPRWLAGLALLRSPRRIALGLGCLFGIWVLDVAQIRLLMGALQMSGGLGAALLVLLMVNVAIAFPVSPGNTGVHELGSVAALSLLGAPLADALVFAVLYHATQTLPLLLAGLPDLRTLLAAKRWGEAAA